MRSALPAVLLAGLILALPAAPARAESAKGEAAGVLKQLVVRPMEASASCSLSWRSMPHWLKPGKRLVDTVISGWLGYDSGVTPASLRLGISGVYYESEKSTLALIALAMKSEEDAVRTEKTLIERHGKTTGHRFMRRGPYVVILAVPPPTNDECTRWMWEELGRRFEKATA